MTVLWLARDELYNKVWNTPMRTLAKEFGISDRALAKKCDKHNIPKPPLGYWAKVQHGQSTKKPRLPINKDPNLEKIFIQNKQSNLENLIPVTDIPPEDPRLIRAQAFIFPAKITKYEESIRNFRRACAKDRIDRYGFLIPNRQQKSELDIKISYSSFERTCRLLQGIIALFKSNDWVASSKKHNHNDKHEAFFVAEGEEIYFKLKEKIKQIPHVLTPKEVEDKKKYGSSWAHKYDYVHTGELTFSFEGYWPDSRFRAKWSDKPNRPLEKQLTEITKGFIKAIQATREKRLKQEEQSRLYAIESELADQRRHHAKIESKRRDYLIEVASSFEKSQKIRNLVNHLQLLDTKSDCQKEWLDWAEGVANELDPSTNLEKLLEKHIEAGNKPKYFFEY